jgi:hypothetical protein
MHWKVSSLSFWLSVVLPLAAQAQASVPKEASQSSYKILSVLVPTEVATLLRPILDEEQKGIQHDESRLSKLVYGLTQKQGHTADEALVVLMCFDVGESQEETDAVIGRGKRMLPLLKKYQDKTPKIAGRTYPDSMLKGTSNKADTFEGTVKAIKHGWHSTADNPEG